MQSSVKDIIEARLGAVGLTLSEVELNGLLVDHDLTGEQVYDKAAGPAVKTLLISHMDTILARPDVEEGGYKVKWDRVAVTTYCNMLRMELGLITASVGTVTSRTDRW
ncbi:DUF6706 family protein [Fibrella forsythiae]|uniref:Uncharacterized protein n=1 Tax=Fibrella forsythiae TaxID=2817061 RepID=A0ABS3JBC1_9BACT|nr:DUF6706 family protein [Fibrella forsythiae]MBO0947286.1 hypothetical protein [Fibrella forsythiae]